MRASTLVVHDREASAETNWTVDLAALTPNEAGQLRYTIEEGRRTGHDVSVVADDGEVFAVRDAADAQRWSATLATNTTLTPPAAQRRPLLDRKIQLGGRNEAVRWVTPAARLTAAAASLVALWMLLGALGSEYMAYVLTLVGVLLSVASSLRFARREGGQPVAVRVVTGVATLTTLAYVALQIGSVSGLLAALRGPMPSLLMLLVILHGFEVGDRRTLRIHLATGAVVIAYATGLRTDGEVSWWLVSWGVLLIAAIVSTARTVRSGSVFTLATAVAPVSVIARRSGRAFASLAVAGAATFGILSVVPVPDGPASLGLPALSNNAPTADFPGGLAGPDGGALTGGGTRGALGQAGGYRGFSETLDTSIRGDLGDDVVMRVRAPEPAFWRGQTFTEFDGRTWSVSPETGSPQSGPRINVEPSIGDLPRPGANVEVEEFVQTYFVEADLPNVVFAAARADELAFEGNVWSRPDGALRSDVTLTKGSAYTVTSQRPVITPDTLRAQGDLGEFFSVFDDSNSQRVLAPFLALPATTSRRTLDLASELRQATTYDTIIAYQDWLSVNTVYDLNAPVPAPGEDAVDDYLFESRRGFCEQIASSLAIMLRSQGVPARLATGYIPGTRDRISGVFEVRASDAHAWVEVWFPDTGWEAFDPTAQVPLSGTTTETTVGADVVDAAVSGIGSRVAELALLGLGAVLALALIRLLAIVQFRRRRGRWGLLQDRFNALVDRDEQARTTAEHGAVNRPTNPDVAATFVDPTVRDTARDAAWLLDQAAFDPTWEDSDADYGRAKTAVALLERSG